MAIIFLEHKPVCWFIKALYWFQKRKYGQVLAPIKAWSRCPQLMWAFLRFNRVLHQKKTVLAKELKVLVCLYVSQLNGCEFCIDWHTASMLLNKHNKNKISDLKDFEMSELFTIKEKAALSYAKQMSQTPVNIRETCIKSLKVYFSDNEIVELTALIGFQHLSSKFNAALDISGYGFCQRRLKE